MGSVLGPCRKCGVPFIGKYCKPCQWVRSAEYRRRTPPETIAAQKADWSERNKEQLVVKRTAFYVEHREEILARNAVWVAANTGYSDLIVGPAGFSAIPPLRVPC